jgi:hypothetical protein
MNEVKIAESRLPFEVTWCEHPARASLGTSASQTGSAKITPAAIHGNRFEKDCLLMEYPFKNTSS